MKFLVLGASGATGSLLLAAVLDAGHEVTALARDPAGLPRRTGLHVVTGDVTDADSLVAAGSEADALVSTLGSRSMRRPEDLIARTSSAVVEAAGRGGPARVVFLSAFGAGDSYRKGSALLRLGHFVAAPMFRDKDAGERILTASGLDWTLVYPGVLTDDPAGGAVTAVDLADLDRVPGTPRVSRADVAQFLLDAAVGGTWSHRVVVLSRG